MLHGLGKDDVRPDRERRGRYVLAKFCMLKRIVVDVCKRGDLPNPPQDRGGVRLSQMVVAAPERTMCSQARCEMNDWGEPVSNRAMHPNWDEARPLWILILVVNEEWSMVTIPGTRHGPCSTRGLTFCAMCPAVVVTEKTSPPWSGGTFGKMAE